MGNGYCFQCGSELSVTWIEDRPRQVCPVCGWVYYPQLKVSAAGLVEKDGKILLVRRKQEPWAGYWYLPAGYVEADEDPARAAGRELFEETGVRADPDELFGLYYFDDDPRGNGLLIVYRCQYQDGEPSASTETEQGEFFAADALPAALAGAGQERALADWLISHRQSLR